MNRLFIPMLAMTFCWLLTACEENSGNNFDACNQKADQTPLLTNVSDILIIPAYQDLSQRIAQLSEAVNNFVAAPSESTLAATRSIFKTTYLSWQRAAPFEFGPAEAVFLKSTINNFPLNETVLQDNLNKGTWNLDAAGTYDKGLPALDYLLYGVASDDQAIVTYFMNTPNAKKYLTDVVSQVKGKVDQVVSDWTKDYRAKFIANTGTAAGTGLSLIINSLNEEYEYIKRDKLGIPSGVVTLGFTNPTKVEAYHSGLSLELLNEALNASEQYFLGKNGIGLDDYLNEVDAMKNGEKLSSVIKAQYQAARNAIQQISSPLSEAVDKQNSVVQTAYTQLVKQIINIKTDMPSVLCVAITYVDNPSDSD
ncbi:MAG: imelysin family protein [Saprospiraceae bacterium]|nr:imelysin family protein [Saprospiraceae bacterium]